MMSDFTPPSTDSDQACGSLLVTRGDAELRHRADRGQRLAAKAERADLQQILVVELGGGMAIDGQREIGDGHAAAVVGDADPPPAAAIGEDVDPAGAGVDGVLHQFLDHARGTFDHFAGGDAVDDLFGKLADGHGLRSKSIRRARRILYAVATNACGENTNRFKA